MAEQPGERRRFGLHPPTYVTDLLGGQYQPGMNASIRSLLGFQGHFCSLLSQIFLETLQSLRDTREDKNDSN